MQAIAMLQRNKSKRAPLAGARAQLTKKLWVPCASIASARRLSAWT
jgi:hypothetical protein